MTTDPATTPRIICRRKDGLGARMIAILRIWRLAQAVGAEVEAWWPPLAFTYRDTEATDWQPDQLFDLPASDLAGLRLVLGMAPAVPEGTPYLEADPELRGQMREGLEPASLFARGPVIEAGGQATLRLAGESAATVKAGLAALFDRFVPSAPVRDAVAAARAALGDAPYAAIHVRRGDIVRGLVQAITARKPPERIADLIRSMIRRCPPVPLLLAAIEQAADARVIVFGDDPPLVAEARAALGARTFDVEPFAAGLGPLRRALFDNLLLRGATRIAMGHSAFTELPLAVGSAEAAPVAPLGPIDPWLAMFEREVLDAAGVAPDERAPLRALYEAGWRPMEERNARQAARIRR